MPILPGKFSKPANKGVARATRTHARACEKLGRQRSKVVAEESGQPLATGDKHCRFQSSSHWLRSCATKLSDGCGADSKEFAQKQKRHALAVRSFYPYPAMANRTLTPERTQDHVCSTSLASGLRRKRYRGSSQTQVPERG